MSHWQNFCSQFQISRYYLIFLANLWLLNPQNLKSWIDGFAIYLGTLYLEVLKI
ncbi:hypothetical protein [Nostoc sp. JL31]|uniref:hypothetical protein n=1 Tax=Nostoc sp. JL31 TaxID=2815395 RepID=UPI0025FD9AF1|nr:hypothetical protein [Nostoc sp. JL31]